MLAAAACVTGTGSPRGLWVGLATGLNFFVWPLGLWLASIGRARGTLFAALVTILSLFLVLPYTGLDDYVSALTHVGRRFGQAAIPRSAFSCRRAHRTVCAHFTSASSSAFYGGRAYRSFTLAVAAALAASPSCGSTSSGSPRYHLRLPAAPLVGLVFPLGAWGLHGAGLTIGNAPATRAYFSYSGSSSQLRSTASAQQ